MPFLATFISGIMFGLGLNISGLINPAKVHSFLDVAGDWDPSLAITMVCAVVVTWLGYRMTFRRKAPLFAAAFHVPRKGEIDRQLIGGAAVFGLGWGLAGFCPGPALAGLASGGPPAFIFVLAMLAGMAAARYLTSKLLPRWKARA